MELPEDFVALAREVNNWGRWGHDDERGTLNLLDDDAVRRGVASVRDGHAFALGAPLTPDGLQAGLVPGRENPTHTVTMIREPMVPNSPFEASDDRLELGLQVATHWDALAHVTYGGRMWNGWPTDTITDRGAERCGIDKTGPIVGRGVLLDVASALGVDRLDADHQVTATDLDAAAEHAKVTVEPGDIVLIRTGQMQHAHGGDRVAYVFPSPGPVMETVRWWRRHDVAAVAIDTLVFEAFPTGERDRTLPLPVHPLDLVEIGMLQGQNWDLETLATACADDGRYTFLLEATPEHVERGLGAPVNPVAVR